MFAKLFSSLGILEHNRACTLGLICSGFPKVDNGSELHVDSYYAVR